MKVEKNKLEGSIIELKVEFSGEEWKTAQEKAFKKLGKNVRADGFRQGKVPEVLLRKMVSKAAIYEEATDAIMEANYRQILADEEVAPIANPELKVEAVDDDCLKVVLLSPVKPDVVLGEYKNLNIKKTGVKVTKKEVEEELKRYQNEYAELVEKDGAVENGDTAVIDFEGFLDGVAFEGGKGENYPLEIGSGSFIPGFEEQVIGMKKDESKDLTVTFPAEYQAPELAGKETVFKVTVHEVKNKVLPEIDDELAKDVNIEGVETLAQLEANIKERIRNNKTQENERKYMDEIIDTLIKNTTMDIPQAMVEQEIDLMLREIENSLKRQGLDMKTYKMFTNKSDEDIRQDASVEAKRRVALQLALEAVAKAENLTVSDEEVDEEFKEIAAYYNQEVEQVKETFAYARPQIESDVLSRKALDIVKSNEK